MRPAQDLIVLGDDEGEQRRFDGVGLAAEPAIAVFAAIQIVRREGDEPALRQRSRKIVVGGVVGVEGIARHAVAAMLADDHRAALSWF
jgi:hypothetical protein